MDWITVVAKWMLGIEIVICIVFIIVVYVIKIIQTISHRDRGILIEKLKVILTERMRERQSISFLDKNLMKKDVLATIHVVRYFDKDPEVQEKWVPIRNVITHDIFQPLGREFYSSRKVYKRYYAAHIYEYHFSVLKDEERVIKLIHDPVLMISVSASRLAFTHESDPLINAAIDVFSKYRRMQQSVFSTIAKNCGPKVETIIFERITREKNPYTKAFCYKLLEQFPATLDFKKEVEADLATQALDLRIAALNYCGHNHHLYLIIKHYLEDEQWQMRAAAAKLIGQVKDKTAIKALGAALKDKEWWVRIRAAQSLGELGEEGINILKAQSPEIDKYAYEAAIQVLTNESQQGAT